MDNPPNYRKREECRRCCYFRVLGVLNFKCIKYPLMSEKWGPLPEYVCDDYEEDDYEARNKRRK